MKTEEIKKLAKEYAKSLEIGDCLMLQFGELEKYAKRDFKAGAEFINQHWQEKTRWIPVEERLPAFAGKRRTILVKTGDNLYSFLWIMQEVSLSDFECQSYTHWKEIEL